MARHVCCQCTRTSVARFRRFLTPLDVIPAVAATGIERGGRFAYVM